MKRTLKYGAVFVPATGEIYVCWCCGTSYALVNGMIGPQCTCLLSHCSGCGKCSQHCECTQNTRAG